MFYWSWIEIHSIRIRPYNKQTRSRSDYWKTPAPDPALLKTGCRLWLPVPPKNPPAIRYFVLRYCGFHLNGTPQDLDANAAAASFTAATISETVTSRPSIHPDISRLSARAGLSIYQYLHLQAGQIVQKKSGKESKIEREEAQKICSIMEVRDQTDW